MDKALQRLNESKGLNLYKRLVDMFARAYESYSGYSATYRKIIDEGTKIIPADERAKLILDNVIGEGGGKNIQNLMNLRFAELPVDIRPNFKNGKKYETAYWVVGDKTYTKVYDLLKFTEKGGRGKWGNESGDSVSLLEMGK